MEVPELLLHTLQELVDEELKMFHWYCTMKILDSCKPIPRAHLQKASRIDTVSKLTQHYGEEVAVSLTVEILRKMSMNSLAEDLKEKYSAASSSRSSSAQNPPPPGPPPGAPGPSNVAQQGAVIFAPTFTSSTTGPMTINIHKS